MSQRGVAFATAPRRLRGAVAATSLRRLHEPFIRSLRGPSRWVPRKTRNPFEPRRTIFTTRGSYGGGTQNATFRPLLLRRPPKQPILFFGAEKRRFFGAPRKKKKSRRKVFFGAGKYFWGVEKVIWPPNAITRRRRKQKKTEVFPLGRRKILLLRRPPKKTIFGFGRRKKKKNAEKNILGAENVFGGSKKLFHRRTP